MINLSLRKLQTWAVVGCHLSVVMTGLVLVASPARAYENMCQDEELSAGGEVTVNGETYTLKEDDNGLYIDYVMVDGQGNEEGPYTISVASFDEDCTTVHFEENPNVDVVLTGDDVDE